MNWERFIAANAVALHPLQCSIEVLNTTSSTEGGAAKGLDKVDRGPSIEEPRSIPRSSAAPSASTHQSSSAGECFHAAVHLRESAQRLLTPMPRQKMLAGAPPSLRRKLLAMTSAATGATSVHSTDIAQVNPLEARIQRALLPHVLPDSPITSGSSKHAASPAFAVKSADLANIRRIAEINAAVTVFETKLVTSNYQLAWLLEGNRPPVGDQWKTLEHMSTDYIANGGNGDDHVPLLNSPRSVLTVLRNGTHPMALQRIPLELSILKHSSAGTPLAVVKERHALEERVREHAVEDLRQQYRVLCEMLPREEILSFFQLLAAGDALLTPKLELDEASGRYRTIVAGDNLVSEAISAIERKEATDRQRLAKVLSMELEASTRVVDQMELQQKISHENEMKLRHRQQQRHQEQEKEAQLSLMEVDMKKKHREKQMIKVEKAKQLAVQEREARAQEAERATQATMEARWRERHERSVAKQLQQQQRTEAAAARVAAQEEQRKQQLALKEAYRQAMNVLKEEERLMKALERQQQNEHMKERLQSIAEHRNEVQEARLRRAEEDAQRCEVRLRGFEAAAAEAARDRRLGDMKRQLMREEAFEQKEQLNADKVRAMLSLKAEREDVFTEQRRAREEQVFSRRIEDEQLKALKEREMEKQLALQAFQHITLCGEIDDKAARAQQLQRVRQTLDSRVRVERNKLGDSRKTQLDEATARMIERERQSYLAAFNSSFPSDSEVLRKVNSRHASRRLYSRMAMTPIPQGRLGAIENSPSPIDVMNDRPQTTSPRQV